MLAANEKYRSEAAEKINTEPTRIIDVTPEILEQLDTAADGVLEDVHQNHLSFALGTYLIEFDDFVQAISELNPEDRDALFDHVYHEVIHPEFRSEDGKTLAECYHPQVNYENFRDHVWSRDYHCAPHNVHEWVVTALNQACNLGKTSNIQTVKMNRDSKFDYLQKLQKHAKTDEEEKLIASLLKTQEKMYGTDDEIESRIQENADRYVHACEELIPKLIAAAEKPISSDSEEVSKITDTLRVISDRAKSD